MTIWKYSIPVEDCFYLKVPAGAHPLAVQMQDGEPAVWMLVNPAAERVARRFYLMGTGHPVPDMPMDYIGTFQMEHLRLVFHLFAGSELPL